MTPLLDDISEVESLQASAAVSAEQLPVSVEDLNPTGQAAVNWVPRWVVVCGDWEFGVTVDDHCFLVLVKSEHGQWLPTKWIPWQAARKLGELADTVTP